MNVTCDQCGKRYVISDDKIAGKSSVKIRCKECQKVIVVTVAANVAVAPAVAPATERSASPWEDESTRAMPPVDPTAQWFAMVGGKQQGPYDAAELQRRVGAGEVTLRTYLWKTGMSDWKRAADVPEVSPIFAGGAAPPSSSPSRPPSKSVPAVQRDVAMANEVPSTEKPTAQNGAGAVVAQSQPLNDLFRDVGDVSDAAANAEVASMSPAAEASGADDGDASAGGGEGEAQHDDPFAAITGPDDGKQAPAPGEATRFFIAQAGVNKRNPPWKIALFALAFVGGPIALIFILNTLEIVSLPKVTRTTDDGEEVQESFFSAGGAAGLKDLLTGDARRKKEEADRQRKQRDAIAAARKNPQGTGTTAPKEPEPEVVTPRPQDPSLAAFYAENDRKQRVPKVRGGDGDGQAAVNTSGLSPEAVSKVVADKSKAFQTCIDNALRRNPNLAVGNVTVVLNVGPSGAVKSAAVEPKKHETTDWGQCMMSTGKRIVFPGSDGETQVELPFKVGVAIQ